MGKLKSSEDIILDGFHEYFLATNGNVEETTDEYIEVPPNEAINLNKGGGEEEN